MVSVVIHAGCYKTATSTLQAVAQKNRDRFLADHGVLYPRSGARANQGIPDPDSVAHHLLFHAAKAATADGSSDQFANNRAKLLAEIDKAEPRRIFISTELLSFSPAAIKEKFLEYFAGLTDDLTIAYAVRRPDDLIDSMNNQMLRAGRGRTRSREIVDYRADIEQWSALVGSERVRVLYFSKGGYGAYVRRIFTLAGIDIDAPGIATDVYANAPMTVNGHIIRGMIFDRVNARGIRIDRALRHEINLALAPIEEALSSSPKVVTLSGEDRVRILETNRAELDALRPRLTEEDRTAMDDEFARGLAGPHPTRNLEAAAAFGKEDIAAIYRGLIASPVLHRLLAGD